jgi:hypothetical protein
MQVDRRIQDPLRWRGCCDNQVRIEVFNIFLYHETSAMFWILIISSLGQCCRTVTIYYGSGSLPRLIRNILKGFTKFIVKCEWRKCWMRKSNNGTGTQFYTASVRTFVIPFYNGSGSAKAKSYGSGTVSLLWWTFSVDSELLNHCKKC